MKRFLEIGVAVIAAIAITASWERWDRDAFVSNRVDDLVSTELMEIERYVDEYVRPSWVKAQRLGNLAQALCADRTAATQVVRVQDEQRDIGAAIEPVCVGNDRDSFQADRPAPLLSQFPRRADREAFRGGR